MKLDSSPLISVVMSIFNDSERVGSAIESILRQSYEKIEFIVVNDGSTDSSKEVIEYYERLDQRLRVIHQSNLGLTKALILGCIQAQGEFVARQDADDWSHPQRLAEQLNLIQQNPRLGFVSCTTQYIGPLSEPLIVVSRAADPELATQELLDKRQGLPAHGSVMFRKTVYEKVGGYRPEFYFAQDADLWLRMAEQSLVGFLPQVRYFHRRDVQTTSGMQRPVQKKFGELGQLCRLARKTGRSETLYLEQAKQLREELLAAKRKSGSSNVQSLAAANYFIGAQLAENKDRRAIAYLWRTIKANPRHWKAWLRLGRSLFLVQTSLLQLPPGL